jgi:hypothetical protein
LASKRARLIIRLVAIEEVAHDWGMGIFPQKTMATLRLLADYKELHKKSLWSFKGVARRISSDIPLDDLVMTCGHPRPTTPVIAVLREGDMMADQITRGFFCSQWCAQQGGRKVVAVIHYDPRPTIADEKRTNLA